MHTMDGDIINIFGQEQISSKKLDIMNTVALHCSNPQPQIYEGFTAKTLLDSHRHGMIMGSYNEWEYNEVYNGYQSLDRYPG